MRQSSFAEAGFERYSKRTRRERFLQEMDRVVPWEALEALIEPCYPSKRQGAGRPAVGLDRMLRIHFLQHWFNLSDPAVEEALYDSKAMRRFVGIDLGREPAPDETTICKFRHLLEANGLGEAIFQKVGEHLQGQGLRVSGGTIVDATLINAPSSTKNRAKKRDPEMRQTKKGNQWYFGMKAHIGVDARTKLIHSVATTPANVHDSQVLTKPLHGGEATRAPLGTRRGSDAGTHGRGARVARFPLRPRPSPFLRWVGPRIARFQACSTFTRVPARMLAEPPYAAL